MRKPLTVIGHAVMWGFGIVLGMYLGFLTGLLATPVLLDYFK